MTNSIENKLKIIQDQVAICERCDLCKTRTKTVFSRGNPRSYITMVGESPGEEEDLSGLPFVGRSGQLLDKTLTSLGLNVTNDIYVANIIKCRPPKNRKPTDEETNHCIGYLEEQLKIINPKVIVALGATAVNGLINTTYGITKIHGQFFKRQDMIVMPAYHPSYVLRNGSAGPIYDDFVKDLKTAIEKSRE